MAPTLFVLALFVFGGLQTYTLVERKHRKRWVRIERAPETKLADPLRRDAGPATTRPVLGLDRAPQTIRRTALWSLYMGQMAIPGALLGMFGLLVAGLGLVSIPGLILAVRIYRHAFKLLRRDADAELEARKLARFAVILNAAAITIGWVLAIASQGELIGVTVVLTVYGVLSLAHAAALRRCAELLDEDLYRRVAAAAQVAAEARDAARLAA